MFLPTVAVGSFELFVGVNGAVHRLLFFMHLATRCDLAFTPEGTGVESSCLQPLCE